MPSFAPAVNLYSPRSPSAIAWTGQDHLKPFAEPCFLDHYGLQGSQEPSAFQPPYETLYLGDQSLLKGGAGTTVQPNLGTIMTAPLRHSSLPAHITRPPPRPIRPFDPRSDSTFPPLPTAPNLGQIGTQNEGVSKPPGLGDPQPVRQVAFDALVRDASPRTRAVISASTGVVPTSKVLDEEQWWHRRLKKPGDFSESFKVPASPTPQHVDGDQALARRDSSIGGCEIEKIETSVEDTSVEDEAKRAFEITDGPNQTIVEGNDDGEYDQEPVEATLHKKAPAITIEPQQTVVEDHDIGANDQEIIPASSDKKAKREAKNVAREAVTEAWCTREIARKNVVGSWSPEGAVDLRESTRKYHEKRAELESLMRGGKLNDEDAKVFPQFPDLDVSVPKSRPDGVIDAQKKRKEDKKGSPPEASSASHVLAGGSGEKRKASNIQTTGKASPLPSEFASLKERLGNAQKLLKQARDYKKQGRPQSKISYATWKRDGDAKVERATKFYRSKREALAAAFASGLPIAVAEEFPLI